MAIELGKAVLPSDLDLLVESAKAAGLSPEQITALWEQYRARTGKPPADAPPVRICGNVSKNRLPDGRRAVCGRPPHPDEPGNRTPHAIRLDDDERTLITWPGQLTVGEQAEEEAKAPGPKCGEKTEHNGETLKCKRLAHDSGRPHYATHKTEGPVTW